MPLTDFSHYGILRLVPIRGEVELSCDRHGRLAILFGENHRDRRMKRLNVLDALALVDAGAAGCAGTEDPPVDALTGDENEFWRQATDLRKTLPNSDAVIDHLDLHQPWWFGVFGFANTLQVLRPSLPVKCVEDPVLHAQMKVIAESFYLSDLGLAGEAAVSGHKLGDHPHNLLREKAMVDRFTTFWDQTCPVRPAILNTGSDHTGRLALLLRDRGFDTAVISRPTSPPPFA